MNNSVIVEEMELLSKKLELIQKYIFLKFGSDFKEFCQSNDGKVQGGEPPVFVDILDDDEIPEIKDEIIEACPGFEMEQEQEFSAHLSDGDVEAQNDDIGKIEEVSTSAIFGKPDFSSTDDKGRFICPDSACSSTFARKKDGSRHWKTVHLKLRSFVCDRCGKTFQLKHHFLRHAKETCKNDGAVKGKRQSKTVNDVKTMELAVKSIQMEGGQDLDYEAYMEEEVDGANWEPTEIELGRFGCKDCSSTFGSKWDAKLHWKTIHLNIHRFACSHCSQRFKLKHHLKRHLLKCGQSNKLLFSASNNFSKHQLTDDLEKLREGGIENGDNSVSKIKLISCTDPECATTFSSKFDFGRHWRTVHLNLRQFKCNNCKKTYKLKSHLHRHNKSCGTSITSNKKEYVCPYSNCGVNFTNKNKFNSHLAKHKKRENENSVSKPFKCSGNKGCDKMFKDQGALNYHIKQVHDEKTECCYFCRRMFSTRHHLFTHMIIHLEETWYICDVKGCKKSFHTSSNLKRHKKMH